MLKGIIPIVPTPFKENGDVDYNSISSLTNHLVECGVHGICILGALGEGAKLSETEKLQVLKAFKVALPTNIPLIVGVRSPGTKIASDWAKLCEKNGASGLLVTPPSLQNDNVLFSYYKLIDECINIPIIIHDFPQETGIILGVELVSKIHKECNNVGYIKLEDPPTGSKMDTLNKLNGSSLRVFGALGGMFALEELERGAVGIMTGFAYPELLVQLYDLVLVNRMDEAFALFTRIIPLVRFEFQKGIGIALRKHIFKEKGVIACTYVRHPGSQPDELSLKQLKRLMRYIDEL